MRRTGLLLRCLLLGALALGGCSRLVDAVLYRPKGPLPAAPGAVGLYFEDLRFPARDGTELHGWWVPADQERPCVILFHGHAGNISGRIDILRRLHDQLDLGVLLFDYRGYGKSRGRPSETGLYDDARGARALARNRGWDRRGILYFGRSLGAAVALDLALEEPPAGIILEAAFSSLQDVGRTRHPLLWRILSPWVAARYDNLGKIGRSTAPVLFLHGDEDAMIPAAMAWKLFDAAPGPKWFRTIAGAGHEDAAFVGGEAYWGAWRDFLENLE